ncbi:MAG TPA: alpha/beta fold hydrolase [Jatrophihabitans sp.]
MADLAISPGAEPFSADGGNIGVVVSHGFTGSPFSMQPWADHLAAAGYSVRLPLLPGHGTTWQDCNTRHWQDWYGTIEAAFEELTTRCEHVFAVGLSMGGTLTTRLAEVKGDKLAGLVLVNPSYATTRLNAKFAPLLKHVVKSRPGIGSDIKKDVASEGGYDRTPVVAFTELRKLWRVTRTDLARITAPVLMFRSTRDHVVEPVSGELLLRGATSTTVREVLLHDSYHVATLDNDAEQIFTGSVEFIESILAEVRA